MKLLVSCAQCAVLVSALLLGGCTPPERGQSDEEKDPHFLAGKSRVSAMNFSGAIESFTRALQANPKSAMAHFELAWLYGKQGDPAAAIYHYEYYLRLRPKADNAELVRQQIVACKQELARTVSLGPVTERLQRELENLVEANRKLTAETNRLTEENMKLRIALAAQQGSGSPVTASASALPRSVAPAQAQPEPSQPLPVSSQAVASGARTSSSPNRASSYRVHRIKQGETLSSIARQYGLKPATLQAANPGVDPRRLRPGRELNIP